MSSGNWLEEKNGLGWLKNRLIEKPINVCVLWTVVYMFVFLVRVPGTKMATDGVYVCSLLHF